VTKEDEISVQKQAFDVIAGDREAVNREEEGDSGIRSYNNPSDIDVVELAFEEGVV
jgi:hypothetical protein